MIGNESALKFKNYQLLKTGHPGPLSNICISEMVCEFNFWDESDLSAFIVCIVFCILTWKDLLIVINHWQKENLKK